MCLNAHTIQSQFNHNTYFHIHSRTSRKEKQIRTTSAANKVKPIDTITAIVASIRVDANIFFI